MIHTENAMKRVYTCTLFVQNIIAFRAVWSQFDQTALAEAPLSPNINFRAPDNDESDTICYLSKCITV